MERHVLKAVIALATFVVGLLVFFNLAYWEQQVLTSLPRTTRPEKISVALKPIEFFGWWREAAKAPSDGDDSQALVLNDYRKLHQVLDLTDKHAPEQIDIVLRVENKGTQPIDLLLLATGDFLITPLRDESTHNRGASATSPLLDRHNIGQQAISQLQPGEVREIRFNSFSLRPVVDKYGRDEYINLWPSALIVRVNIVDTRNRPVADAEARLRLRPTMLS